jgi:protein-disulfide isomerase
MRIVGAVFMTALAGFAAEGMRLVEGNAASPVRVLIYEDLECSDCADFRTMMDQKILPRFGKDAAFVHRDFPLPKHSWARPAAIAARFIEQTRPASGVAFRRWIFAQQKQITAENFRQKLSEFAKANGVDPAQAAAALDDAKYAALVDADVQDGVARGIQRTPTVLVNGEPFIETFTYEEIAKAIRVAMDEVAGRKQ